MFGCWNGHLYGGAQFFVINKLPVMVEHNQLLEFFVCFNGPVVAGIGPAPVERP